MDPEVKQVNSNRVIAHNNNNIRPQIKRLLTVQEVKQINNNRLIANNNSGEDATSKNV